MSGETQNHELVVNLWAYVDQGTGLVYAVAGKTYALTGTDDEKLAVLKQLASTDHWSVKRQGLPKNFSVSEGNECHPGMIPAAIVQQNIMQAFEPLLKVLEKELPPIPNFQTDKHAPQRIPAEPLYVLTFLMEDDVGKVTPVTNRELSRTFAVQQYKREIMALGFSDADAEEAARQWLREQEGGK